MSTSSAVHIMVVGPSWELQLQGRLGVCIMWGRLSHISGGLDLVFYFFYQQIATDLINVVT